VKRARQTHPEGRRKHFRFLAVFGRKQVVDLVRYEETELVAQLLSVYVG